ncbi:MAG: MBL fold metallo-hydrolase [Minisyncoccia bacterium]
MLIYFFLYFLIYLTVFFCVSLVVGLIINFFLKSKGYVGEKSDHFDGIKFFTPGHSLHERIYEHGYGKFFWKWLLRKPRNHWVFEKNKFRTIPEKRVNSDRIFITFISHSTVLIQTKGLNIITDPVFSSKIGPLPFIKLHRYRDPGIKIEELPKIDLVLLSHNHYDHLDLKSLRYISIRDNPKIFTPLGNSHYLKIHRIKGAEDMDWWDRKEINSEIKVVCVPSQHFSARAISDKNKTLWSGFVLETPRGNIYFAGDTGYGDFIQRIKEKYDKFLIGLIPIGAYKPEWFMAPVHISPEEAIKVHKELSVETSVAIHFGTFKLADDGQNEARNKINKLVSGNVTARVDFRVLENGQTIMI